MPLRLTSFAIAMFAAAPAWAAEVTVFAAASLKTALDRIAAEYEAAGLGDVTVSYAGTSALARQLQAGAPADIFFSASSDWMDAVETEGLIAEGTRRDLLSNTLVLIAADPDAAPVTLGPDTDLASLLDGGVLAMAFVDAVPAGIYGKAALTSLGLWDSVDSSVAQSDNVRAALRLVATGEAPLGIVYATDARAEDAVTVIGTFPQDSHPDITYPVAALSGRQGTAQPFLDWLETDGATDIFRDEGFTVLAEGDG